MVLCIGFRHAEKSSSAGEEFTVWMMHGDLFRDPVWDLVGD